MPVLVRDTPPEQNPWGLTFLRMFDMANDSGKFLTGDSIGGDWVLRGNKYERGGERRLPLYEAKMVHMYTHRFGDYGDYPPGSRSTILPDVPSERLKRADYEPIPRYWIADSDVDSRLKSRWARCWLMGWRDITHGTNQRTVVAGVIPRYGAGDKFLLMLPSLDRGPVACLVGAISSFAFDYCARQKIGGISLKYFTMKQLPVPHPSAFRVSAAWNATVLVGLWIAARVLELTFTSWSVRSFAEDCDYIGPPFYWEDKRRSVIRCELDAAYFHLYGIERDDVDYIMETFPIVKRQDIARTEVKDNSGEAIQEGRYRTKDTILGIYDEMAEAMKTGKPYQTRLDPPPGPPADAEGNFLPLPQWLPGQPRPADWPPHIHPPRAVEVNA